MRGLDFFRLAVELANRLARPRQSVRHTIQTNATLITEEWAEFFAANNFLVSVSIDGPQRIHDAYRVNRGGRGSYDQVIRGYRRLQEAGVELNILCTVHDANQDAGVEIYRHLRDELGAQFMQFIPILERATRATLPIAEDGWSVERGKRILYRVTGDLVTSRSVEPKAWGAFLTSIFDEWVSHDVGKSKRTSLPTQCLECPVRWACHGDCPKDRFATTDAGEDGLNYLCDGYFDSATRALLSPRWRSC